MVLIKNTIAFLLLSVVAFSQSRPATGNNVVVFTQPYSAYGYYGTVLPGSSRTIPADLWAANLTSSGYTTTPSGTTITATNSLVAGDVIIPLGFFTTPMAFAVGQPWIVTAATGSNFTISYTDGGTTTQTESQATARVIKHSGFSGHMKWEIINTGSDTTETYKLQSVDGTQDTGFVSHPVITSAAPVIRFTVGPVEGNATNTGNITTSNFNPNISTVTFDLKGTSVDDNTKTAIYHYRVTRNGAGFSDGSGGHIQGKSYPQPGWQALYKDRYVPLYSTVLGNVNQAQDWTLDTIPGGSDAAIIGTGSPQPLLYSGHTAGNIRVKVCPTVDHNANACAFITTWVSNDSPPALNNDISEMVPCETGAGPTVMGVTWGSILDIKPATGTPDLLSIPQNPTGPLLVRLWNIGANGAPTEYHNQTQVNVPTGGPFSDQRPAFVICGVKNAATGEMPIIDGANATVNSWPSQYIVGPYSIFGVAGPTGGAYSFAGVNQPFSYVTVMNLHIRNVTQGYFYTSVIDGTSQPWGESAGVRPSNAISFFSWIGLRVENVSDGLFDDCNSQNGGWPKCTTDTYARGNNLSGYGYPADFLAHPQYRQSVNVVSFLNKYSGAIATSEGTFQYSDRGFRSIHMYERAVTNDAAKQASVEGGHSENQDAYNILNLDEYWGYQGAASCNTAFSTAMGCVGLGGGINAIDWQAAMVELHSKTDHYVGNAVSIPNPYKSFGTEGTHSFWSYQPYGVGGWNLAWFPENLTQYQNFSYNTIEYSNASNLLSGQFLLWEDSRYRIQDVGETTAYNLNPPYYAEIYMNNNIIISVAQPGCTFSCNTLNSLTHQISHFQTNMFGQGYITPAGPFNTSVTGFPTNGYQLVPSFDDWGNMDPITEHISGWDSTNFLHYTTYPIQSNLVPLNSSQAVGAATPLVGEAAYFQPRLNAVDDTFIYKLRAQPTTLGAYDSSGGVTLQTITVSPSSISVPATTTTQLTAFCHYSDGSNIDCTTTVTWSGGSSFFTMDAVIKGQVDAISPGTAPAVATIGIVSGSSSVTVTTAPIRNRLGGLFKLGGLFTGH